MGVDAHWLTNGQWVSLASFNQLTKDKIMARKTKAQQAQDTPSLTSTQPYWTPNDAEWGGFINIRLTDEQREQFTAWYTENPNEWWILMDDVLSAGMKVGSSYDIENQCYIVTLTGRLLRPDMARFVLTSRASTLDQAFSLALWKHVHLAGGNYIQYSAKTQNFKQFG